MHLLIIQRKLMIKLVPSFFIMGTFLFDKIIFGPVKSRRLGVSLGINLLPNNCKLCNFNCIYCECGITDDTKKTRPVLHSRKEVYQSLESRLIEINSSNKEIDAITFAGNGEPTLHPDFAEIIDDTVFLRNKYHKKATIAVLSNASTIHQNNIFNALQKIDQNILKLDSAFEKTIALHNNPGVKIRLPNLIENLKKFDGNLIIQTMFVQGVYQSKSIDNTTEEEVTEWLNLIKQIRPREVMIYTIERDTPTPGLIKVPEEKLHEIGKRVNSLGINTQISA